MGDRECRRRGHPVLNEREVLAAILDQSGPEGGATSDPDGPRFAFWYPQADAILAAGFRLPTVSDVDRLRGNGTTA